MVSFEQELLVMVRAGYAGVVVQSAEWLRVEASVAAVAARTKREFQRWTVTDGWKASPGAANGPDNGPQDPVTVWASIRDAAQSDLKSMKEDGPPNPTIHLLHMTQEMLREPMARHLLRDTLQVCRSTKRTMVIVAPALELPPDLEKELAVLDFALPDRAALEEGARAVCVDACMSPPANGKMEKVVSAALGLTEQEAENAFARSLVETGTLEPEIVLAEKKQVVRKSGVLEFYEAKERAGDIGGLDDMIEWLEARKEGFTQRARAFGLTPPRGLLICGVSGGGKSLTAKAASSILGLPILRMDFARLMGSLVGQSEGALRRALSVADALAPTILFVDEVEKGLAGAGSNADSGVSARLVGQMLQWMQDRPDDKPVFVIMTANNPDRLPAELLRKGGRIDEIFAVDLPSVEERAKIAEIHLRKRGLQFLVSGENIRMMVKGSEGYVGAEIEEAVKSGMWKAFSAGRAVEIGDVLLALGETTPLSETMADQVQKMREWAQKRARNASRREAPETGKRIGRSVEVEK